MRMKFFEPPRNQVKLTFLENSSMSYPKIQILLTLDKYFISYGNINEI